MGKITYQKHCEFCGSVFTARTAATRFCSHLCSQKAYKVTRRRILEKEVGKAYQEEEARRSIEHFDKLCVMTPRLAAEYLSVGKSTIYRYIKSGQIKILKLPTKTLIRKADLDSLFQTLPAPLVPPPFKIEDGHPVTTREEPKLDINDYYLTKEVMEKAGMSLAGVKKLLEREGIEAVHFRDKDYYNKVKVDKVLAKRAEENHPEITEWYSTSEIIKKYNMTQSAVYSLAYDYAVPKKKVKSQVFYSKVHVDAIKSNAIAEQVMKNVDGYLTYNEIMEQYHLTRNQVDHYLRFYKVKRIHYGKIVKVLKSDFDRIFEFRSENPRSK